MHNCAFEALGVDARYLPFDIHPDGLGAAIARARSIGVRQLAVSLPHKVAVMEFLDEVDPVARRIGAVNTVTRDGDRLIGANTDWLGAVKALEARVRLDGKKAVVLGAGGTARAVVYGLQERGATVNVLNRTQARAEQLALALGAAGWGELDALEDTPHDVLVNTTSVGLRSDNSPVPARMLRPDSVVMDAVYDPEHTRLLQDATARGARIIEGKWMLVHQAAEQVRLWTGKQAPVEAMARAFDAADSSEVKHSL